MVLALVAVLMASAAVAQGLPVKVHSKVKSWKGDRATVIASAPGEAYTLVSAHKEGGRPWADALFEKQTASGKVLVSRAYDCANATYRWLGEARTYRGLSLSVTSLEQVRDRRLQAGTVEYALARYVCGL
ncbi:MAG: hypothetical protein AAFY59_03495 [Pseudomonadota bacterium]